MAQTMLTISDVDVEKDLSEHRCLRIRLNGTQCPYKAINGTKYCAHHGGLIGFKKRERMGIYATAWAAKIQQMASHPDLLTLNEEIGVTRMILENVLGACDNELELIAQAPQIQRLVAQVQALVTQCDKIQRMNANIFTEAQLVEIALRLGEEVAACIEDPSTVDKIRAVIAKVIVGVDTKVSDLNAAVEDQLADE